MAAKQPLRSCFWLMGVLFGCGSTGGSRPGEHADLAKEFIHHDHLVVAERVRAVDGCVVIIRPAPPSAPQMVITVDTKSARVFTIRSDRRIFIDKDWQRGAFVSCDEATDETGKPTLDDFRAVDFSIVNDGNVGNQGFICITASADSSLNHHAKKFNSIGISSHDKLLIEVDDPAKPGNLYVHFKNFKYQLGLSK